MTVQLRIRDLLAGKTLIETTDPSEVRAYWDAEFRIGKHDWAIQYLTRFDTWSFLNASEFRMLEARHGS